MASQAVAPAQATQAGSAAMASAAGAAATAAAALTITQPLASTAATQLPTLMPHGQRSGPTPCWASSGSYSITPYPHASHSSHAPGHTCACGGPGSGAVQLCSACSATFKVAEEAEGCRWLGGSGPGLAAAGEGLGAATSIQLSSDLTRSATATSNQTRSRDSSDDDVSGCQGNHSARLNAAHFNSVASNGFHVPAGLGPAPTPTHFNMDLGVTPVPMEMGSVTSCGAGEHEGSEGTCEANEDLEPLTAKHQVQATRLAAPGGPVFSLARQPASPEHDQVQGELLYCGTAAHQLLAWPVTIASSDTASASSTQLRVMAAGYPGCVQALAASGPWLFSVANHCLLLHDTRRGLPSLTHTQEVMKGNILALAAAPNSSAVFVGTAAGGIHGFSVTKTGSLKPLAQVSSAHSAAVTGLAVYGSRLYSVGLDGALQAWSTDDLTLAAQVHDAHLGASMHCITLGPDGLLYTGGDDKLVRRWHPLSAAAEFLDLLEPKAVISPARQRASLLPLQPAGAPLASHCAGVRALATGSRECLVSGDAQGDLCIWTLAPRRTAAATSP
ncbi:WD40-repeat-containing domain protein [Haematococcus lacustris]